ncbi:MAG: nucleotidyltransferase family protein [Pseudonocardiaceae bacterium]
MPISQRPTNLPRERCAILLAAGEGRRLRPLTAKTPKPLVKVGGVTLLDRTFADAAQLGFHDPDDIAVNAHHLADQIVTAVDRRAHIVHEPRLLGTAGTIVALADWIGDRDAVIFNADAYRSGGTLAPLLDPEDSVHPRLLVVDDADRGDFGGRWHFAGISVLPNPHVRQLAETLVAVPKTKTPGLYKHVWRDEDRRGRLQLVDYGGTFIDCGTSADLAAANEHAATNEPSRHLTR